MLAIESHSTLITAQNSFLAGEQQNIAPALHVRLATGPDEVAIAQRLRYQIFFRDRQPSDLLPSEALDCDEYDLICDHLLVIDRSAAPAETHFRVADGAVVGTYRLLRQEVALAHHGFYSQQEFDLAPLLARKPGLKFLELGRSCVVPAFRTKPVIALLWQGIWDYVRQHRCDVMFGCASFEGCDAETHYGALHFLKQNYQAPAEWQVKAQGTRGVNIPPTLITPKEMTRLLPPLIKGYLRLGCYIGEDAVVDPVFKTVDVLIILPVERIAPRYFSHFGSPIKVSD